MFSIQILTFQSNCAEGLHFSAFHFTCKKLLSKKKLDEFLLRCLCPERVTWLYFVAHAKNGLPQAEVGLLARDEKRPASYMYIHVAYIN